MAEDLRYPIGKFERPTRTSVDERGEWIRQVEGLPAALTRAVSGFSDAQLDTPYREGGWTVRQLIHHVADSHMNSQIRFRWTLTEETPMIKAYDEKTWAELADARTMPVAVSLDLLRALHGRWVALLRAMTDEDFARKLRHPESGEWDLGNMLALYAWHGRHHTAHVLGLRKRMGWELAASGV